MGGRAAGLPASAGTPTHIPLIAAIGASVFLQELVRLLQGARDRWLAPVLTDRFTLAGRGCSPLPSRRRKS